MQYAMLLLFKKSPFTKVFLRGYFYKECVSTGAHEHYRHAGHHPLLPVAPPGGARGLRDHRQGRQDRASRQGNKKERDGEDSLLAFLFINATVIKRGWGIHKSNNTKIGSF